LVANKANVNMRFCVAISIIVRFSAQYPLFSLDLWRHHEVSFPLFAVLIQ